MKIKIIPLALAVSMAPSFSNAQDAGPPPGDGQRPPPSEPGHAGFRAHVLPPGARERLNLTAVQERQIAVLEEEVKGKLETILTSGQIQQLQQMRPPPRRGGGPGGPGGDDRPPPPPPGD